VAPQLADDVQQRLSDVGAIASTKPGADIVAPL